MLNASNISFFFYSILHASLKKESVCIHSTLAAPAAVRDTFGSSSQWQHRWGKVCIFLGWRASLLVPLGPALLPGVGLLFKALKSSEPHQVFSVFLNDIQKWFWGKFKMSHLNYVHFYLLKHNAAVRSKAHWSFSCVGPENLDFYKGEV